MRTTHRIWYSFWRLQRGHIIVTEKATPFLSHPVVTVRQTDEGSVMIGDSVEEAGFDVTVGTGVVSAMAARAVRISGQQFELDLVASLAGEDALENAIDSGFVSESEAVAQLRFEVTGHAVLLQNGHRKLVQLTERLVECDRIDPALVIAPRANKKDVLISLH